MRYGFVFLAAGSALAFSPTVQAELIYGLLNNNGAVQQLVTFDSSARTVTSTITLQIGTAGNSLSSIDVSPTGKLYGFTGATDQIYSINTSSGALTAVGAAFTSSTIGSGALEFDPTTSLIRLVGTAGGNQNLRVDPTTGAVVATDPSLAYAAGDSGAGLTPNIVGDAFSKLTAGASTLYDVDSVRDVLVTQNPASAGTLQTVGSLGIDIGSTGQGFGSFTGFDISGATGTAYLTDSAAGTPVFFGGPTATTATLYTVNLGTGAVTSSGLVSGLPFGRSISDIAVVSSAVPEPSTLGLLAAGAVSLLSRRRRA